MPPTLQSRQEVIINAPLPTVWGFGQDLSRIPEYHPRVNRVDLLSGQSQRAAGVAYRCHLSDGKNSCVEKDIEVVPMERIVTALPEDTMGISRLLPDYVVETVFTSVDRDATRVEFHHFYSTRTLKLKLLNLFVRPKIARESQDTLNSIKKAIEKDYGRVASSPPESRE